MDVWAAVGASLGLASGAQPVVSVLGVEIATDNDAAAIRDGDVRARLRQSGGCAPNRTDKNVGLFGRAALLVLLQPFRSVQAGLWLEVPDQRSRCRKKS